MSLARAGRAPVSPTGRPVHGAHPFLDGFVALTLIEFVLLVRFLLLSIPSRLINISLTAIATEV